MKKFNLFLLAGLIISLSSCEVIGGIFEAGFNTGIVVVIIVIVLLIVGVVKMFGGGNKG